MVEDPLSKVTFKSDWISRTRLSFKIVLDDDVIEVRFRNLPRPGEPWCASYTSSSHGDALRPLKAEEGNAAAEPEALAHALCEELGISTSYKVQDIERNFVDLMVPDFVRTGPVRPNHPRRDARYSRVQVCTLFADLRGFSDWVVNVEPEDVEVVLSFISDQTIQMAADNRFDYWKLLGDGIMLVWETPEGVDPYADVALEAAFDIHKGYWHFRQDAVFEVPVGFGIAVTAGHVTKQQATNWSEKLLVVDYVGPVVNCAARLQDHAQPGEVLVNKRLKELSKSDSYIFEEPVGERLDKISQTKGIPTTEREVYFVRDKYLGSEWDSFCGKTTRE